MWIRWTVWDWDWDGGCGVMTDASSGRSGSDSWSTLDGPGDTGSRILQLVFLQPNHCSWFTWTTTTVPDLKTKQVPGPYQSFCHFLFFITDTVLYLLLAGLVRCWILF